MRFFSPPEKPTVERTPQHVLDDAEPRRRLVDALHEVGRLQLVLSARAPLRVERGLQKRHRRDAGNFDRILKGEKHALGGALMRREAQNILAVQQHFALRDIIALASGDDIGERRFAGAVRPHDRRDLAVVNGEREAIENLAVADGDMEIFDFKHGHVRSELMIESRSFSVTPSSDFANGRAASISSDEAK